MTQALPFRSPDQQLKPEWIDYNGHLNMAYYSVLFDNGIDGMRSVIDVSGDGPNNMGPPVPRARSPVRFR